MGANIMLNFNEAIARGTGSIVLDALGTANDVTIDVSDTAQVSISGTTVTINPSAPLAANTAYDVLVSNTAFTDMPVMPTPDWRRTPSTSRQDRPPPPP